MTDLSTVQTGADRKTVCNAATAAQAAQSFLDEQEAAKQATYAAHFSAVIANWCNETDVESPDAKDSSLDLRINEMIDDATLDGWESDLAGRGYTVTRSGDSFKIDLPA